MQKNSSNDEAHMQHPVENEEENLENEFEGSMNPLELENDEYDDWSSELDVLQSTSKNTAKNLDPVYALDQSKLQNTTIPAKFSCSLSKQMMSEPVRIAGSRVPVAYERAVIEAYYDEHGSDPMTDETLDDIELIPDLALKRAISDFCLQNKLLAEVPPTTKKTEKIA